MTNRPSRKRQAGEEPALARNSRVAAAAMAAPSTMPTISGRMYCTLALECIPRGACDIPQEAGDTKAHVLGVAGCGEDQRRQPHHHPRQDDEAVFLDPTIFSHGKTPLHTVFSRIGGSEQAGVETGRFDPGFPQGGFPSALRSSGGEDQAMPQSEVMLLGTEISFPSS